MGSENVLAGVATGAEAFQGRVRGRRNGRPLLAWTCLAALWGSWPLWFKPRAISFRRHEVLVKDDVGIVANLPRQYHVVQSMPPRGHTQAP